MAADRSSRGRNAWDWTTDFPTPVLARIFSFLPHRSALRFCSINLSLLMAFWEHLELLTHTAALDFEEEFAQGMPPEKYISLVDGIIRNHKAEAIESLKICFKADSALLLRIVRDWLKISASKCAGVVDLDLGVPARPSPNPYPSWVRPPYDGPAAYAWSSLTALSVSRCPWARFLLPLELPSLQMLSLTQVEVEDDEMASLLLGCPMLLLVKLVQCHDLGVLDFTMLPHLCGLTIIDCMGLSYITVEDVPMLKSIYYYGVWIGWQLNGAGS